MGGESKFSPAFPRQLGRGGGVPSLVRKENVRLMEGSVGEPAENIKVASENLLSEVEGLFG